MKLKAIAPLLVAIVFGLLAARLAMKVVNTGTKIIETTHLTSIVVAAHDMEPGTTLIDTDMTLGKVDEATIPSGAYIATSGPMNRVTKIAIVKGQAILPNVLADDGAGYGVAATLPQGMRAITVDINDTTGVAGFIQPQSRVDVVTTIQADGKPITKTLLESVMVLAVGSRTNPNAVVDPQQQQSHTVTLLVKPKDAEKLELASTTSRVRLLLRNGRDTGEVDNAGVTLADLKGDSGADPFAAAPAAAIPAADVATTQPAEPTHTSWTVEIIKAGQPSSQTFDIPVEKQQTKPNDGTSVTSTDEPSDNEIVQPTK